LQIFLIIAVTESVRESVLQHAYDRHRLHCPDLSDRQHFNHLAKTLIPPRIQGSPAYYRERLADLLAMVDKHGMPAFFLTLTADEVSGDLRWEEIKDLDTFMLKFNAGLNWQNAPVECATMFHERLQSFMNSYIRKDSM
jgi:Helitron helicase-like domain at N-terminus